MSVVSNAGFACGEMTFEQALRVDRSPSALSFAAPNSLPATQGQRSASEIPLFPLPKICPATSTPVG
jgi:hypothetical protein